jgi:hypothetical protein
VALLRLKKLMPKAPRRTLNNKFFQQGFNNLNVRVAPLLTQLKQMRIKGQVKRSLRRYDAKPIVV